MDSSDTDNGRCWNRELFVAISKRQGKGPQISEQDRCEQMRKCLFRGADIDTINGDGNTVLHIAVKKGYQKVVRFLRESGAKTDISNNRNHTAITLAENANNQKIVSILNETLKKKSELQAHHPCRASEFKEVDYDLSSTSRKITLTKEYSSFKSDPVTRISKRKLKIDDQCDKSPKERRLKGINRPSNRDYKKPEVPSGLKRFLHGNIYQLKHLMLILNRARKKGYPFRLTTELRAAEKFDDLVLEYKDSMKKKVHRLVQVKHKQDDTRPISVRDLLDVKDGDFSLLKYFISWRKVKKHSSFRGRRLRNFILCTNIDLDVEGLRKANINVIEVKESDEFLEVIDRVEQPPRYHILVDEHSRKKNVLYDTLASASDVHRLAKVLTERVHDCRNIDLKIDIFKYYHVGLAREVIDITNRRFSDNFIRNDGLSDKAKKFRKIFFLHTKKLPSKKNKSEKDIWKSLENMPLKISSNFGKERESVNRPEVMQFTQLPDKLISKKEISDFLSEFTLAVKQPNEVELSEMIKREIGADSQFNLLDANFIGDSFQNTMLDWVKETGEERIFLVNKDAVDFFNKIEAKLSSLIAIGLSLEYPEMFENCGIMFKRENRELQKFLNSFNLTDKSILELISSKQTFLTALRVHQTLKRMKKFEENDSFIFIRLETLVLPRIMPQVLRAFQWPHNHNLLVVDCQSTNLEQFTQQLWNPLCQIMKKNAGKRMILIIQGNYNSAINFDIGYEVSHEMDDDTSINNLEKNSLQKILETMIIVFQGQAEKTSFGRLLGIHDFDNIESEKLEDLQQIIDSSTLLQLIQGKIIRIGSQVKELDEIQHYYIPRTILRHVVIKEEIFKALGTSNLFAISGIDKRILEKLLANKECAGLFVDNSQRKSNLNEYVILEKDREISHFEELCEQNSTRNIHWLEAGSGQFIWKRSFGDITDLMKYQDEGEAVDGNDRPYVTYLTEDQLTDHNEQSSIVILSDTAGMGKTTILTHLAGKMKEKMSSLLVLRVDLNRHTSTLAKELKNSTFNHNDSGKAVDFLVDKLLIHVTDLESQLFKIIIKQGEAALLIDGFDEISPTYTDTVNDLLRALAKLKMKKLFVTSRPHASKALEKKLGIFSHTLQPFSAADQMNFLTKFWKSRLSENDLTEATEVRLIKHAQGVMKLLAKSISNQMKDFTGVPLQTRLVAEVFPYSKEQKEKSSDASEEITNFENDETKLQERIDIIDLYSRFVDEKHRICCTEKKPGDDTNLLEIQESELSRRIFLRMHQKYALDVLFDEKTVRALLDSQPEVEHCIELCRGIDQGGVRTGIVAQVIGGKPYFIHRTFAEYFAAGFIINTLKDDSRNKNVREFFMSQLFVQSEHKTIRAFINCLLKRESNTPHNGSWEINLRKNRNADGATVYHVAAQEGNVETVRFFLNRISYDSIGDKHRVSQIQHGPKLPVESKHSEASSSKIESIIPLLKYSHGHEHETDINLRDRFHQTPLAIALNKGCNLDVVKYFVERGADINCTDWINATPLHIAARNPENVAILEYLIEKGAEIRSEDKYGSTPLHNASANRNLKAVQYLIERGANLNSQKENSRTPLHAAASKVRNLDVVEYLIRNGANINSQDEDGRTPLHTAINEADNLEVVKFLIKNGADVNLQEKDGWSPLHAAAAEAGNLEVVKYLIEKGADINSEEEDGWTPLHAAAAETGNLDVVQYLIENGADIHSQDKDGRSPLYRAMNASNWDTVRFLLGKGADANIQDKYGKTPQSIATLTNDCPDVVQSLFGNLANVND